MDWKSLEWDKILGKIKTQKLTDDDFVVLARNREDVIRQVVALHPDTPNSCLEALCNDESFSVRENARVYRYLPGEWQEMYTADKIRALKSTDVEEQIIEKLAISEDAEVRQAVAWSPCTPDWILGILKQDKSDEVRYAADHERILPVDWRFKPWMHRANDLLANQNLESLTEKMYEVLLNSPKASYSMHGADNVLRGLSLCSGTPQLVLEILENNPDTSVKSGLRERELPDDWAEARNMHLVDLAARIRKAKDDMKVLEVFSSSHHYELREAVAKNPTASQIILEKLAADPDTDVAEAASKQLKKRFPESNLLRGESFFSSEDSEGTYLTFAIRLSRAPFVESYEYWEDESCDEEDALEGEVTGKATGEIRFDLWDLQGLRTNVAKNEVSSFSELQSTFIEIDDSAWAEQIGELDQEIISSDLPRDNEYSNMKSATILLDENVLEISVESHCNGQDSMLVSCSLNEENVFFSDEYSGKKDLAPADVMSLIFSEVSGFIDKLPKG